jgi:hypothetical protein
MFVWLSSPTIGRSQPNIAKATAERAKSPSSNKIDPCLDLTPGSDKINVQGARPKMEIGTLCRLSTDSIYISKHYRGLTVIIMEEGRKRRSDPSIRSPSCGFYCFVVEKSKKLWFFDYQLEGAETL